MKRTWQGKFCSHRLITRVFASGLVPRAVRSLTDATRDHTLTHSRGRKIFEPPRFMSVPTAVSQLMSLLEDADPTPSADPDSDSATPSIPSASSLDPATTLAISLSRVGDPSQTFVAGTLAEMAELDEDAFGGPLHSFVIVGRRFHALERDFARRWAINKETWDRVSREVYQVRD